MIRLRVLGSTELQDADGRELTAVLAQPKRLALLVYLAASRGFHRRDTLFAMFWPELDATRAREALNQAVRFLRKELRGSPESLILSRGAGELGVEPGALWCDAAAFCDHFDAKRYGEALDLYRGDLLPGFFSEQAGGFEEWLERERSRLRSAAARAARELAEERERDQSYTTAVISARRAVELAGLDERVVRDLLTLLDRLGDRAGAIHAYEEFARRLANELDAEPAAETKVVVDQIRKRAVAGSIGVAEPRPPASPVARPNLSEQTPAPRAPVAAATGISPVRLTPDVEVDRWRIIRDLGRGGMATVYMAHDMKHDRYVALKVLRPELTTWVATERFLREIQITAQLAHPHILPLIDSGSRDGLPYLVTPYVAGESLRARLDRERKLPVADALRLAAEIAEALDYAHRCGIIHRDIKPENILLADGHAIVADFGIARAVAAAGAPMEHHATASGVVIGSPSYMSPEALAGGPVGVATDIYALGCVLVEMLTGVLPNRDLTVAALVRRHGLERDVAKLASDCTSPVPEQRPQTAAELVHRLEQASRGATLSPRRVMRRTVGIAVAASVIIASAVVATRWLPRRSATDTVVDPRADLAVLYFDDNTLDKHLGHVAAGLTEDLIDRLSQVEGLRVISPNGVRLFRDSSVSLDTVARRLNVATIVTGSVSGAGPVLRVAVRLVDARTGRELQGHTLQRPMWDLFTVQDSIADDVSLWLRDHLGRQVRLRELQNGTRSVEAWQAVHQAEELIRQSRNHDSREPALLQSADSLLREAERRDPRWVEPMARRTRVALSRAGISLPRLAEVIALADSVLMRSPNNAEALAARGEAELVNFRFGRLADAEAALHAAETDLRLAVTARPTFAKPWAVLGDALLAANNYADAIGAYQAAMSADPFLRDERQVVNGLFFAFLNAGRFDDAEGLCRTARSRFPGNLQFEMCQIITLGYRGSSRRDVAAAWSEARRIDEGDSTGTLRSSWSFRQMMVAAVLVRAGLNDSARSVIARTHQQLNGRPLSKPAEAYVDLLLGDRDSALRLLDEMTALDPRGRIGLARNPWFRSLSDDPRFRALSTGR